MLCVYVHSRLKRAETVALLDSGATENFININYAQKLNLPIWRLTQERRLFNVNGTLNKAGTLKYYTDIVTRTGTKHTCRRYFLTDLGDNQVILGYLWFASAQPRIDWAKGWIDYQQLPIIMRMDDTKKAMFATQVKGRKAIIRRAQVDEWIPHLYRIFANVLSNQELKKFPPKWPWDHKIELKPGAPVTLISKTIKLSTTEQEELKKFVDKHLEWGTIRRSTSPYTASFFFIKKKNGKLRPVQDYRPINKWTIKNRYPLPLIPQLIDRLGDAELITMVNIHWGYKTVWIVPEDQHKAAFITNQGLFELMVMFFELTNSHATFQTIVTRGGVLASETGQMLHQRVPWCPLEWRTDALPFMIFPFISL
jgi:hypothetical protein